DAIADQRVRQLLGVDRGHAIVNAVDVDAGGEDVGGTAQRQRRQEAAVRAAPDADAARIDVGPRLQPAAAGDDVQVLGCAAGARLLRVVERVAVADAE